MLFSLGHGQHVVTERTPKEMREKTDVAPIDGVAPELARQASRRLQPAGVEPGTAEPVPDMDLGKFRYYFPDAPGLSEQPDILDRLDALAESMVEDPPPAREPAERNSETIAPIFTYFGQFIDHDVTANTDRDSDFSQIDGAITPAPRNEVELKLGNLRSGALELDSLYGDSPGQDAFSQKLAGLMRHPTLTAKMRLGVPDLDQGPRPPLPETDNATDLLRLRLLLDKNLVTVDELRALDPDLRANFIDSQTNEPIPWRAIIGDARNDENLLVAQFHALLLRFHNKLVDATGGKHFEKARQLTRWHYQWLVVNSYLRTICDPAVLDEVIEMEAPLYHGFFGQHGTTGPKMPMPLEFSLAAFRFGHSMVRAVYDHNRIFGEAVDGTPNFIPVAPFNLLFGFTGNGRMRPLQNLTPPLPDSVTNGPLPVNWVIEWDRFLTVDPEKPLRHARKIDTDLAPPLGALINEGNGASLAQSTSRLFKHLARRNLRRSYKLNVPTAQSCYAAMQQTGVRPFWMLTPQQIASGSEQRRQAVMAGNFHVETPLWFYLLKEAEVINDGEKLGPLGSHLVANTLLGLIIEDPNSYWHDADGHWAPSKFRPHDPLDSLEKVARFCGMVA